MITSNTRLFYNLVSGAPLKRLLPDPGPMFIDQLQQARLMWDWQWKVAKGIIKLEPEEILPLPVQP